MKRSLNVIACKAATAAIVCMSIFDTVYAQFDLQQKIDSLFIIASSGEVRHRDQNEPAMDSIAVLGAPAVPYLINKFTTRSARERWTIIWTLQRIGSPAVPDLVIALKGSNALVVKRVAWALGDIKDSSATVPLMEVANHPGWNVREQVVGALGKIGDGRADNVPLAAARDTIGQVRKAAAVACGRLGIQKSIPLLVHLMDDDFYGARMAAAHALLSLDTELVITTIVDSMVSVNRRVGHMGCRVLGELATPEAQTFLIEQAQSVDPLRRAHAALALIRTDPEDNCGILDMFLAKETDRFTLLKIQSAHENALVRQR